MIKRLAIFSCTFGLLVGCAETNYSDSSAEKFTRENSSQPDVRTAGFVIENMLHLSFDENYFMKKGQNFRIASASEKSQEKKSTNDSESQKKEKIDYEKSAYITNKYLGIADGKHVIVRTYKTGGSGIFTDIVLCSIKKENLHIDDVLMVGDRALDGIVGGSMDCVADCPDRPYLGSDGNLYLKMRLSISTVASLKGISDKDTETGPFQSAQDFWNISECIYNLKTKKLEIVAMDINFEKNSDVAKILDMIFPNHGKTVRIERDEMSEFLQKFKSAYLKLVSKEEQYTTIVG